ncbi:MAG: hypothetical protein PHV34_04605 [Verrucomicrobiae bacterium]|nr:hypothetical protein [Verrucomicrobiae bacterium]
MGKEFWSLEARVPFAYLERTPEPGEKWRWNAARDSKTPATGFYCWAPLKTGFHDIDHWGELVFLNRMVQGTKMEAAEREMNAPFRRFAVERFDKIKKAEMEFEAEVRDAGKDPRYAEEVAKILRIDDQLTKIDSGKNDIADILGLLKASNGLTEKMEKIKYRHLLEKLFAEPGGVSCSSSLIPVVTIGALLENVFSFSDAFKEKVLQVTCANRMKTCGLGIMLYALDHQGNLPNNGSVPFLPWAKSVVEEGEYLFKEDCLCPAAPPQKYTSCLHTFGMKTARAMSLSVKYDPQRPLLVDSVMPDSHEQISWGIAYKYSSVHCRHEGRANVLFMDLSVEPLTKAELLSREIVPKAMDQYIVVKGERDADSRKSTDVNFPDATMAFSKAYRAFMLSPMAKEKGDGYEESAKLLEEAVAGNVPRSVRLRAHLLLAYIDLLEGRYDDAERDANASRKLAREFLPGKVVDKLDALVALIEKKEITKIGDLVKKMADAPVDLEFTKALVQLIDSREAYALMVKRSWGKYIPLFEKQLNELASELKLRGDEKARLKSDLAEKYGRRGCFMASELEDDVFGKCISELVKD